MSHNSSGGSTAMAEPLKPLIPLVRERVDWSRSTIERLAASGKIPSVKIGRRLFGYESVIRLSLAAEERTARAMGRV